MSPKTIATKIRDNKDVIIRRSLIIGGVTAGTVLTGYVLRRIQESRTDGDLVVEIDGDVTIIETSPTE